MNNLEILEMEEQEETQNEQLNNIVEEKKEPELNTVKVIIVDSTSFSVRKEDVFFNKRMEEVEFELLDRCKTTIIHRIKEYVMNVLSESEKEVNQTVDSVSKIDENTLALLEVRRDIIKVAKSLISKRAKKRLLKKSSEIDAIIINEKLD